MSQRSIMTAALMAGSAIVVLGSTFTGRDNQSVSLMIPTSAATRVHGVSEGNQPKQTSSDVHLRSTKELQAQYPDLFNRLDVSPYHGSFLNASPALRHFRKRPFTRENQDAYEAIVAAFAFHVRMIPEACLAEISWYEEDPEGRMDQVDLGLMDPITLDGFLRLRTAVVDGLLIDDIAEPYKEEALKDIKISPILFYSKRYLDVIRNFETGRKQTPPKASELVKAAKLKMKRSSNKESSAAVSVCLLKAS